VSKKWGSGEKAKAFLQFEPQVSLEEGLADLIQWYQSVKKKSEVFS
jgi:nucleoside-diphosphate-sugar epimerase